MIFITCATYKFAFLFSLWNASVYKIKGDVKVFNACGYRTKFDNTYKLIAYKHAIHKLENPQ